jgi:uncharacterized membrane protein YedE/YeeE
LFPGDYRSLVIVMSILTMPEWSPYLAGAGIGVLSWVAFLLSDKPLGVCTAFAKTAGMIERKFTGGESLERPYWKIVPPGIDWQWMVVVGILIGGFLSAWLSGTFMPELVPDMFATAFGNSAALRILTAVLGGLLLGFGARMAGGCTSGNGISGTLQLQITSWSAVVCFFAAGIATAMVLYGVVP